LPGMIAAARSTALVSYHQSRDVPRESEDCPAARAYRVAMRKMMDLKILAQPDDVSCGPTCLHALYQYYGDDELTIDQVMRQVQRFDNGGTLLEILACHALKRGYAATIYTYHVQMFDPTWFAADGGAHSNAYLAERLKEQLAAKKGDARLKLATRAMLEFLDLGGEINMRDLTPRLISEPIAEEIPIITGLSSTFLYRQRREYGPKDIEDDIKGEPQGHFVMIIGYDSTKREALIADPLDPNPPFHTAKYRLSIDRLLNAVLLGILTYDANLLIVRPKATE